MNKKNLTLAAAQIQVKVGENNWNLEHSVEFIREAAKKRADLVCFPESVLDGYALAKPELPLLARPIPCPETDRIAASARAYHIWVLWSLAEKVDDQVANTALLFDRDGNLRLHYRKSHLCTEEGENKVYLPGDKLLTVEVENGFCAGVMICFDRHFPEVARTLRLQGANLILHPTATDWFIPDPEHINHAMMRTRAYENHCYVLSVNQVNYGGGSALYGPWGEVLAAAGIKEELLFFKIDQGRLEDHPENCFDLIPSRRPEMYAGWESH